MTYKKSTTNKILAAKKAKKLKAPSNRDEFIAWLLLKGMRSNKEKSSDKNKSKAIREYILMIERLGVQKGLEMAADDISCAGPKDGFDCTKRPLLKDGTCARSCSSDCHYEMAEEIRALAAKFTNGEDR